MQKALVVLAAIAFVACSRDKEYEAAGTTDTTADTTNRLQINAGMKTDTLSVPVIETKKDTIIVDKPVGIGKKKVEVKRPTVDVKKP
jgi:hypothetical protein